MACEEGYHTDRIFRCNSSIVSIIHENDADSVQSLTVAWNREPNYVAAIGGDYFGMNNDALHKVPSNVSTVIDLLEDKGISWSEYQEDMPYTGFEGFAWPNQKTGKNDYVRKHK